ncbi:MAG TPA: cation diffusion facilitator family transporter [Alphaproteobacteria bacterium]|nr:cation diffusion facilitator family transporter [Alphaproteobacteria bacterium]
MAGTDHIQATLTSDPQSRAGALMRGATYASVTVAGVLVACKLAAWLITGSVAVMSSMIDSGLDMGASLVNLWAVRHALTPADREHRFGHGKAEALAGLAQSAFIAGSALFLVIEAGSRLFSPHVVAHSTIGIGVMVLSIVLTLALVLFQRFVIRHSGSVAISADSLHYTGDLLANLAVIAALLLAVGLGWQLADPIFAILVAGYIFSSAYGIFRRALDQLMDRELPEEQRRRIKEIAQAHPEVAAVHDLRTRSSGMQTFIQLHLEMDGRLPLHRAHDVADAVEHEILQAFPEAEVIIHEDPAGIEKDASHFQPAQS